MRTFVDDLRTAFEIDPGAPGIVMATLAGELHEMGALLATATAASDGWDVTYLGPNLPAEQIALVARQKAARAIGLSIVLPTDEAALDEELRKLRRHVSAGITVIVGGRGASKVSAALGDIDAIQVADLQQLRQVLRTLPPRIEEPAHVRAR